MQQDNLKDIKNRIRRDDPIPLYYQLEKELEKLIVSGVLTPGTRLPGDMELSRFMELNTRTVANAMNGLKKKGLIVRKRRAGTFIKDNAGENSPTIGFFYFKEAEERIRRISEHIYQFLHPLGFDLKIIPFEKDFYETVNLYQKIRQMNLSGAIIVTLDTPNCKKSLTVLEKDKFPYIRWGNALFVGELKAALVRGDDMQAVRSAMEHLWKLGHRRIGLVCASKENETENAYKSFYAKRGGLLPRWVVSVEFTGPLEQWEELPGDQIMRGYLEMNPDVTAIVTEPAAACVNLLRQMSIMCINVPQDISIISLRDWEGLKALTPPVSCFEIPYGSMAKTSVDKLLQAIRNGLPEEEEIIKEEFTFIKRKSVSSLLKKETVNAG